MGSAARLIVVGGLPGTGKTTLCAEVGRRLSGVHLRVDAVEAPLIRAGIDVGPLGYEIVREVARTNLAAGMTVLVDLVNPLPVTRAMWRELAADTGARLVVVECVLPDGGEHRRRVESRRPDIPGQTVPTWDEVVARDYVPWDEHRDGPRTVVDTSDLAAAVQAVLRLA